MPEETIRSAAWRISLSVTLPANQFHEFQPIGGVFASCDVCANEGVAMRASAKRKREMKRMRNACPRHRNLNRGRSVRLWFQRVPNASSTDARMVRDNSRPLHLGTR